MFTVEQLAIGLLANGVGLVSAWLLKTAPPRLVLSVCLISMIAGLLPWTLVGERFATVVPVAKVLAMHADFLSSETAIQPTESSSTTHTLMMGLLGLGLAWAILTLVRSTRTLRAWRQNAISGSGLSAIAHINLSDTLGRVRIHRLPDSSLVATTGLWQTEVWIGSRITEQSHLTTALNHELCHIAAHDQLTLLYIVMVERLLWWNPLVWILGRRARRCLEQDCDARCQALVGRQSYRYSLAELFLLDRSNATALGLRLGYKSDILYRMEALGMNTRFKLKHATTLACAMTSLVVTGTLAAADNQAAVPAATLIECHRLVPAGVQYDFRISSDIDTRDGRKGKMSVTLVDSTAPDSNEIPVGSEQFVKCVQGVVGVGKNEGWPES